MMMADWRRATAFVLGAAMLAIMAAPCSAADVSAGNTVIRGNNGKRTVNCRGGRVAVYGDHNHLTVRNCGDVQVNGNRNEVSAEFAVAGHLEVDGRRNRISWHAPAGVIVKIGNVGVRNTVTRY